MLWHDFLTNESLLMSKWQHYFPIYEKHLSKFVGQSVLLWEIGVARGGSLQMWKRYLGPFVQIIGIDINPECLEYEAEQISINIGDQTDTQFLQKIIDKYGYPDIVIDDGSHVMEHVIATFQFLYDKVSKNGVYLVEDMHTSYWENYNGGLNREGTFIELCKSLIDSLNARYNGLSTSFADTTFAMSFYDSVVAFDKMRWFTPPYAIHSPTVYQRLQHTTPKVAVFGTGAKATELLCDDKLKERISFFIDNNPVKQTTGLEFGGMKFNVFSPQQSVSRLTEDMVIIISSFRYRREMQASLDACGIKNCVIINI